LNFLKYNFEKTIEKQNKIILLLDEERAESVKTINNSREYDFENIALLTSGKHIRIIHRHLSLSWFIHPSDEDEFWKIRRLIDKRRKAQTTLNKEISLMKYRAYLDTYENKNIEQIMTKGAIESYVKMLKDEFGIEYVKKWKKELKRRIETTDNVKIYIIDNPFSVFTIYITENEVMSILLHSKQISGIKLYGKRTSEIYIHAFDEMKSKAIPLIEYIRKI